MQEADAHSKRIKEKALEAIDKRAQEIKEIGETILRNPELGFHEVKTSQLVKDKFKELGLKFQTDLAVTGVRTKISGPNKGPNIAILGEMDAIICRGHPFCDGKTGAAHACGHHAQIAAMLGCAVGFVDSGIIDDLSGSIEFVAVPAEEFVEIEDRLNLRKQGKIKFFGGKQEFIRLGLFDDVDIALASHLFAPPVRLGGTSNGFVGKSIVFLGKAAHAGLAPYDGINALNAAALSLVGIHMQRETFRDEDFVRVHPIITKGGDIVNTVPDEVTMEAYVRARTIEAIKGANTKVNNAVKGAAMAIGAKAKITDIPGYLPEVVHKQITDVVRKNVSQLTGIKEFEEGRHMGYSTDMGDVTQIMPSGTVPIAGAEGRGHTPSFLVTDPNLAYVASAKSLASIAVDLLSNKAALAKNILADFTPKISKSKYMDFWAEFLKKD